MWRRILMVVVLSTIQEQIGASVDSHFSVDPEEVQLKEIAENVKRVSGAVLGLTEYVMQIRNELKILRDNISSTRSSLNVTTARPIQYYSNRIRDPIEFRKQSLELADKVEKLLAMDQSPEVDLAKEELKRTVEKNFLRMLAAVLVTGPMHTQERSDDIFKLMRSVLNGELDFTPVVQRLPLILRDSETNQFVSLLITLRESERGGTVNSFRQEGLYSVEDVAQEPDNRQLAANYQANGNQVLNAAQLLNQLQLQQNQQNLANVNTLNNVNTNVNGISTNNGIVTNNPNNLNNVNSNLQNNNGQISTNQNNVNMRPTQSQTQSPPNRNQLPTIDSILEAMTQTNQFIQEIPSLVEGLQTIVESIEGLFG